MGEDPNQPPGRIVDVLGRLTGLTDIQEVLWSIIDIALTLPVLQTMQALSIRFANSQRGRPVRAERPYTLTRLQVEPNQCSGLASNEDVRRILREMER